MKLNKDKINMWCPLVGEENKTQCVETFPMHFKALSGSMKGKAQRGQYLLVVNMGRYKIYVSELDTGRCVSLSMFLEGG